MQMKTRELILSASVLASLCLPAFSASAANFVVSPQCYLPGPQADDRCTVLYHVRDNAPNYIVCTWFDNSLVSCEGRQFWGGAYEWVTSAGTTVEFRHHTDWPTNDPEWPNAERVRNKGQLLKSQRIAAAHRASPTGACDVTVQPGASIQSALDTGVRTICLAAGIHNVASDLLPHAGQTLRSANAASQATLRGAQGISTITITVAGVTVKDLIIDTPATARATWGVLVHTGSNALIENVSIYRPSIGVGVNEGASNVEVRNSQIVDAGDGQAGPGGASPSMWINNSNNVRVIKSTLKNLGIGPEGDGELACYNTPNLLVQNSTVSSPGASGMYIVNCDQALVIGNTVENAKEWGLDIVNTGQPSGSEFGLYQWNRIQYSRNGGAVLKDSPYNSFLNNTWTQNRRGPNASGSCNGVNRRGNTYGFWSVNDVGDPWPVYCND